MCFYLFLAYFSGLLLFSANVDNSGNSKTAKCHGESKMSGKSSDFSCQGKFVISIFPAVLMY